MRFHRIADKQRLIVKRCNPDIARQRGSDQIKLILDRIRYEYRIRFRLTKDVEENGRMPVGSGDCIVGLRPSADYRNVTNRHRGTVDIGYDNVVELFRSLSLTADQRQLEPMILIDQSR